MEIRRKTNNFDTHGHNEFGNKPERHKEILWERKHRKIWKMKDFRKTQIDRSENEKIDMTRRKQDKMKLWH